MLIPVLDNDKHYWVGDDEVEKLLRFGEGWLADHPAKKQITRRDLKHQPSLAREVIEHLDPPRLAAFERVLFEFAKPKLVVVTTPNSEYNVRFKTLPAGKMRHHDHRFE